MKNDKEKIASKNLRSKGYDVESYRGKYQASKLFLKSDWKDSLDDLLTHVCEIEKSFTYKTGVK